MEQSFDVQKRKKDGYKFFTRNLSSEIPPYFLIVVSMEKKSRPIYRNYVNNLRVYNNFYYTWFTFRYIDRDGNRNFDKHLAKGSIE